MKSPFEFQMAAPQTLAEPAFLRVLCNDVAGPWVVITAGEIKTTIAEGLVIGDQDEALLALYDRKWQAGEISDCPELEGLAP